MDADENAVQVEICVANARRIIGEKPHCGVIAIARELRISASWLERLFKQHTGACIRDHIIRERMKCAAHLLATTDRQIKEIATHLGYAHAQSFIRTFIRHHKKTPLQHRIESRRKSAADKKSSLVWQEDDYPSCFP